MQSRAYATFQIKSTDEDQRIIEGVASTPEVDRAGDVVVPEGATFHLPMPLLWQHDSHQPIGTILSATVTKAGIKIRAQIAKDIGLPEIERAWRLIKAGLVRGFSIGFKALEMEPLNAKDPWGGQRFTKWLWLETSAVTIPANGSASIQTIKQLDLAQLAATGAAGRASSSSPAAVGTSTQKELRMVPISDTINSTIAELRAKSTRLDELETREGADGSLDPAELQERDTLTQDVTTLTGKVNRLKAQEAAQAVMARPAYGKAADVDVRDQGRGDYVPHVTVKDNLPPGIEFARAIMCRMAALRTGVSALDLAKHHYRDYPRIQAFLKEAVPAGSAQDSTWAGPLVYAQNLVSEFVGFLRPQTILGRIDSLTRVPFNVRIGGQTSGAAGYWVGEGRAKPLTKFDTNATTMYWAKVANIAVITEELARFSNPSAETYVRNELARACQERLDIDFIDPAKAAVANVSPASITNGITNLNSAGNTLANVDTDVNAMMSQFAQNHIVPTHWIMPNTVALALSLMRTSLGARAFPDIMMNGGTFMGLPVITSQYCILGTPANNLVLLISAPDIFLADDGGFSVDISREASLEMDDAPTMTSGSLGSPTGASGSVVVSMFQTNSMAIRCERFVNWARRRSAGVVWMDDVQWTPS